MIIMITGDNNDLYTLTFAIPDECVSLLWSNSQGKEPKCNTCEHQLECLGNKLC